MINILEGMVITYNGNRSLILYLHDRIVKALPKVASLFAKCDILTPINGTVIISVEGNIGEASFNR